MSFHNEEFPEKGDEKLAKLINLLKQDIDVNEKDVEGKTLLYRVLEVGNKSMLQMLKEKEPELKDIYRGHSAQFWAVYHGRTNLLPLLLLWDKEKDISNKKEDININYYIDRSMLAAAKKHGHSDLVSGLIRRGADVLFKSKRKNETALTKALRNRDFSTATVLLQAGDFSPFVTVLEEACKQYFAAGKGGDEGCYRAEKLKSDVKKSKNLRAIFSLLYKHLTRVEKYFIFSPAHRGNLKENSFDTFLLKTIYDDTNLRDWFYDDKGCPIKEATLDKMSDREEFRTSLIAILEVKMKQLEELALSVVVKY